MGWLPYGAACYYVPPPDAELLSQYQAQGECAKKGADLASVHGQAENLFVRQRLWDARQYPAWIGLFRSDEGASPLTL